MKNVEENTLKFHHVDSNEIHRNVEYLYSLKKNLSRIWREFLQNIRKTVNSILFSFSFSFFRMLDVGERSFNFLESQNSGILRKIFKQFWTALLFDAEENLSRVLGKSLQNFRKTSTRVKINEMLEQTHQLLRN